MIRLFHLATLIGLSLGVLGCSNIRDPEESTRYLPSSRGVLSGDFEGPAKNISKKFPDALVRWSEFGSLKALLDYLFDGDNCYLTVGTDTVGIRAHGQRQARVYLNFSPLNGSAEWVEEWISGKRSDPLQTVSKMLAGIKLEQVVKIEWYDACSSGEFIPPPPITSYHDVSP